MKELLTEYFTGVAMQNFWPWWKEAVVYQIYPRSFFDTNGDGIGDLNGICHKLDYLNQLGVDALWISPVYPSPMKDCGYDISNYEDIDPIFGNLSDLKNLTDQAHQKGIKILMDLVINHTSDQHPWFQESRDPNSAKADWYIWHKGVPGKKPNNWICGLEMKNAWWWDEKRKEYYLGTFTRFQPELNWRNPEVKAEIYKMIRFWLDMGIDGFRMDVVNWYVKDAQFRSNPWSLKVFPDLFQKHLYDRNQPETHEICKEIRKIADSYEGDRMLVGEIFTDVAEEAASYHGKNHDELHMAFNFNFMYQFWSAKRFYRSIQRWYKALPEGAWPNFTLSNHDYIRHFSRYKWGKWSDQRAKVAISMTLTLRGTPFLYYGEEIGMENTKVPSQEAMDPIAKIPFIPARAKARTPMQWNSQKNAGFTTGVPWLPVNENYTHKNVQSQLQDQNSIINYYIKFLRLRKNEVALRKGGIEFILHHHPKLMAFYRSWEKETILVMINFSSKKQPVPFEYNKHEFFNLFNSHETFDEKELQPLQVVLLKKVGI